MPFAVTEPPFQTEPLEPPRKKWTRSECEAMEQAGILGEHRLELLEGELISKMGKKRPHSNVLFELQTWLRSIFGARHVQTEVPIDVAPEDNATNEPEPDIIVVKREVQTYRSANPQPEDLHLVVAVADTSLSFDRSVKARLYARAGIVEYLVVDVKGQRSIRTPRAPER